MNKEIDAFLLNSELAINNSIQIKELSAPLAEVGYDTKKMQVGKQLHQKVLERNEGQKKEYGEQHQATENVNMAKKSFHKIYIKHVKIARVALENNLSAYTALELGGKRKRSLSGYVAQGQLFYGNLLKNSEWKAAMEEYKVTTQKLEEGQQGLENIKSLYETQKKETGEAQKATESRDQALDEFDEWYSKFKKMARIALEDDPQLLEMLGIVEPSDD